MLGAVASAVGGLLSSRSAKKENDRQYDLARNSIKYRVEDAKNAGIHPLYAMGAPTISSSHTSDPMGDAIASAGSQLEEGRRRSKADALVEEQARANIAKTRAETDQVMQQSRASKLALAKAAMHGTGKARSNAMTFGGNVKVTPRNTPASEGEDYFGETGIPYTIWNTIDHLQEDAPKAWERVMLHHKTNTPDPRQKIKNWWRKFKRRRGWN